MTSLIDYLSEHSVPQSFWQHLTKIRKNPPPTNDIVSFTQGCIHSYIIASPEENIDHLYSLPLEFILPRSAVAAAAEATAVQSPSPVAPPKRHRKIQKRAKRPKIASDSDDDLPLAVPAPNSEQEIECLNTSDEECDGFVSPIQPGFFHLTEENVYKIVYDQNKNIKDAPQKKVIGVFKYIGNNQIIWCYTQQETIDLYNENLTTHPEYANDIKEVSRKQYARALWLSTDAQTDFPVKSLLEEPEDITTQIVIAPSLSDTGCHSQKLYISEILDIHYTVTIPKTVSFIYRCPITKNHEIDWSRRFNDVITTFLPTNTHTFQKYLASCFPSTFHWIEERSFPQRESACALCNRKSVIESKLVFHRKDPNNPDNTIICTYYIGTKCQQYVALAFKMLHYKHLKLDPQKLLDDVESIIPNETI